MEFDLKSTLSQAGLTQTHFANISGVHKNTVSRWISGDIPNIPSWVEPFLKYYKKSKLYDELK